MRSLFVLLMFVPLFGNSLQAQSLAEFGVFEWLVGAWDNMRVKPGETAGEVWEMNPEYLSGKGFTIRGADTVFIEHLKIMQRDGDFFYVATVSHNPAPVFFKMTEISATGFVSENPQHDFPKKIEYDLREGILTATISAGTKQIPFRFQRKNP